LGAAWFIRGFSSVEIAEPRIFQKRYGVSFSSDRPWPLTPNKGNHHFFLKPDLLMLAILSVAFY